MLTGEGYTVHAAHPEETPTNVKARIKTDKTSSGVPAEHLRVNRLPQRSPSSGRRPAARPYMLGSRLGTVKTVASSPTKASSLRRAMASSQERAWTGSGAWARSSGGVTGHGWITREESG